MIEESAPFSLGISFEPDLVKVARNGELLEVELFQHVPIACKRRDHMCSLQISFISKLVNHINDLVNYEYLPSTYCGLVCIGVSVKIGKDIVLECYEFCFYLFIISVLM